MGKKKKQQKLAAFVFWLFQNANSNTLATNPLRHVVWKIFWLVYQPIYMDFTRQRLQKHHTKSVMSVAFHPRLPLFATGSGDKSTILYDISTSPPTVKFNLKHHTNYVMSVAFHPSLPLLATGSGDKSTIIYDISTSPPTVKHHLKHHTNWVHSVAFHPRLPLFATCSNDTSTILYNLDKM